MSEIDEIPFNYEDCHDASTDAREAEESFGETVGDWISEDSTLAEVAIDFFEYKAADDYAERICDFGEESNDGGNTYSLDFF